MRRRAERQILPVRKERGIGTQALRDLFGLALLDRGSSAASKLWLCCSASLNGFVECDPDRTLGLRLGLQTVGFALPPKMQAGNRRTGQRQSALHAFSTARLTECSLTAS